MSLTLSIRNRERLPSCVEVSKTLREGRLRIGPRSDKRLGASESELRVHCGFEYLPQKQMYQLPDQYMYEIALDDPDRIVRYWAWVVEDHNMDIGQRVRVGYIERGIPLVWSKITVTSVELLR